MSVSDVNVTIDIQKVIGEAGTGYPLIVYSADETADYVEYTLAKAATVYADNENLSGFISVLSAENNPPEKIAFLALSSSDFTASGIVSALTAVNDNGFRQIVVWGLTSTLAKTIMAYVEDTTKILFAPYSAVSSITSFADYERTVAVCGSAADDSDGEVNNIACILGATGGLTAGSFTYKNTIVVNGTVMSNDTYLALTDGDDTMPILAILTKAGDDVVSDGSSLSGEFIDVIDSKDYIVQQLEYQTQKVLNTQAKVPYTNTGIAMLEAAAISVLKSAYTNGMIADNEDGSPAYSVSYALREDADDEDIQDRRYVEGSFEFVLSGAIHYVKITGTIKYVA